MTTRKSTTNQPAATTEQQTEQEYLVNGRKFTAQTKIKFRENPKRKNSQAWARYEKYQVATTWAEYMRLNDGKYLMADARHDLGKEFLQPVDGK